MPCVRLAPWTKRFNKVFGQLCDTDLTGEFDKNLLFKVFLHSLGPKRTFDIFKIASGTMPRRDFDEAACHVEKLNKFHFINILIFKMSGRNFLRWRRRFGVQKGFDDGTGNIFGALSTLAN